MITNIKKQYRNQFSPLAYHEFGTNSPQLPHATHLPSPYLYPPIHLHCSKNDCGLARPFSDCSSLFSSTIFWASLEMSLTLIVIHDQVSESTVRHDRVKLYKRIVRLLGLCLRFTHHIPTGDIAACCFSSHSVWKLLLCAPKPQRPTKDFPSGCQKIPYNIRSLFCYVGWVLPCRFILDIWTEKSKYILHKAVLKPD